MSAYYNPPPEVPWHVIPVCEALIAIGGILWTVCYILMVLSSIQQKTYSMPLFVLALDLAWEFVFSLFISEDPAERLIFFLWLVIDCGLIYGTVVYGRLYEWKNSPLVARHLGKILAILTLAAVIGHYAFASWWINNSIGSPGGRQGKLWRGKPGGPDVAELKFWTANIQQAGLSAACLAQLIVRGHSGGTSWAIWGTRTLGSLLLLEGVYGWAWWFWPEAHGYVVNPFSIWALAVTLLCDFAYPLILWEARKREVILGDGRRIAADSEEGLKMKKI